MFYLNSLINFGIPPVLVFQLEVSYKVDRLLTGLTTQQKGKTAQWYSNKTPLPYVFQTMLLTMFGKFYFLIIPFGPSPGQSITNNIYLKKLKTIFDKPL